MKIVQKKNVVNDTFTLMSIDSVLIILPLLESSLHGFARKYHDCSGRTGARPPVLLAMERVASLQPLITSQRFLIQGVLLTSTASASTL